jgi:hypothetical protein
MAGDAKTPGDAKNSPFGNGAGNVASTATGGGQPESYGQSRPQKAGTDDTVNPMDIPPGGPSVFPDLDPKGPDTGNPVGTTAGKGKPPFKLHG